MHTSITRTIRNSVQANNLFFVPFGAGAFFGAGLICGLVGWLLFVRMAVELNKVVPSEKRIPLLEYRYHISEIRRLHEEFFPRSMLRTTSSLLTRGAVLIMVVGTVLEIAK
jgi:hypothetical protein